MTDCTLARSVFDIPRMDCPSEENLIRMALAKDAAAVHELSFDLANRRLTAVHAGAPDALLGRLAPLGLGAQLRSSGAAGAGATTAGDAGNAAERRVLVAVLAINAVMFVVEFGVGWIAQSAGLIADSLDMFADAAVYGVSLYAVGRSAAAKARAAGLAGALQLVLALGVLAEVVRRYLVGSEPVSLLMMSVGAVALVANIACLVLVSSQRHRGAHMKASAIFSANDVLANAGVIAAGLLVWWTGSPLPDLAIGTVVGLLVLNGARRILALR
jgi:Co/Zn/Cd efflux system component